MPVRVRVEFVRLSAPATNGVVENTLGAVLSGTTLSVSNALAGDARLRAPQFSTRNHTGYARVTPLDGMVLAAWGAGADAVAGATNGVLLMPNITEVLPLNTGDWLSLAEYV